VDVRACDQKLVTLATHPLRPSHHYDFVGNLSHSSTQAVLSLWFCRRPYPLIHPGRPIIMILSETLATHPLRPSHHYDFQSYSGWHLYFVMHLNLASRCEYTKFVWIVRGRVMIFNATFNSYSVISWQSVLLMEDTRDNLP